MDFLKAEQLTSSKWRVNAIPFGGPMKGGKDLQHEFFTPDTDIKPDWFDRRPLLFHHGMDEVIKDEDIGIVDDLTKEKDGWWVTTWLERSRRYFDDLNALLTAGKMYGSSASMPHLVQVAKSGEIIKWPYVEQTFTPTPANIFARVVPAKAVGDFTTAGIAVEPLKALLADLDGNSDLGRDLASAGDDPANVALLKARTIAFAEAQLARYRR